jgi:hypothetical protein
MLHILRWVTNQALHCGSKLFLLNMPVTSQRGGSKMVVNDTAPITPSFVVRAHGNAFVYAGPVNQIHQQDRQRLLKVIYSSANLMDGRPEKTLARVLRISSFIAACVLTMTMTWPRTVMEITSPARADRRQRPT